MQITLKEAIKEFPRNKAIVISNTLPDNFKELSYKEKYKHLGESNVQAIISCDNDELFFGIKSTTPQRCGRNIFLKDNWRGVITYKDGKLKVTPSVKYQDIDYFFSFINRPIVSDLDTLEKSILCKPSMIKAVLRNKIYGIESFYKEYMNVSYHLKNFDWRLFRNYIHCNNVRFSILDLMSFTKDLRTSMMRIITDCKQDYSSQQRFYDLLHSAMKLDEVVDFSWSDKRIAEEHLRQTRQLMSEEIAAKEHKPVYNTYLSNYDNIKLLNTEQDVYMEGMMMHHCLYTCYWSRIKNRQYVAFHMKSPEDCTFSVRIIDDQPYLDQIYLAYDRRVQDETREIAMKFMLENAEEFKRILSLKQNNLEQSLDEQLFGQDWR